MINLFRVFHVLFASMTLALLPVSFILNSRMKKTRGTPAELVTLTNMLWLGRIMGMVGGLGILISGGALVGIEKYAWFSFTDFPWLAWKQTLFVLILCTNFGLVIPTSKKLGKMIDARMSSGDLTATDEIRSLGARIGMYGILMSIFAWTAMTLGVSKGIF